MAKNFDDFVVMLEEDPESVERLGIAADQLRKMRDRDGDSQEAKFKRMLFAMREISLVHLRAYHRWLGE